jgi:hypothetical protein
MNTTNHNQLPPLLAKFVESNFLKVELVFAVLFLIGLVMKSYETANSGLVLMISIGTLGILYFLGAFIPPSENESSLFRIIGFKVLHISWTVATVGLLFLIQNYPGAMTQTSIGAITMLTALVLIILTSLNSWNSRVTHSIIRSLIILLLLYVYVYVL